MTEKHSAVAAAPTLSVILPNFNHGRYLPRALDALLAQDRPADEIIVIDDGSTDDSREIISSYAVQHSSIRSLPNAKNIGVIGTLTRGLNTARGKYVYFGAADDFVLPGFFSAGIDALQANPQVGMFCGEMTLVDGNSGKLLGARPPVRPRFGAGVIQPLEFAQALRHNDNFILTGASLLRRDAVAWAGGFNECLSTFADGYLVRKVAFTFGLYYWPRACLQWNIFSDSVSRTTSTDLDRARTVFAVIENRMASDPVFPVWYHEIFARRWRFSLCRLAIQECPVNAGVLADMGVRGQADRALLEALSKVGGRAGRVMTLAWLWLRLRPYSISGLVSTALARRWK